MTKPKVVRCLKTFVTIRDKQGNTYEGIQAGVAEICGDGTTDGESFYVTTVVADWPQEQLALMGHAVRSSYAAVDYLVWEVKHGDNEKYTTVVYPGDLILFINGKIIPFIGEQVKLLFDVTKEVREIPLEPDHVKHGDSGENE